MRHRLLHRRPPGSLLLVVSLLFASAACDSTKPQPSGPAEPSSSVVRIPAATAPGTAEGPSAPGSPPDSGPGSASAAPVSPAPPTPPVARVAFRTMALKLARLPLAQLPYQGYPPVSLSKPPYPTDRVGVRVVLRSGVPHYSPVALAQQGVGLLDSYAQSKMRAYLDLAVRVADRIRAVGVRVGSALYLGYDADFAMHNNAKEILKAPWYSGMAQGLATSFLVRLAAATNDQSYLTTATALVAGIYQLRVRDARPWVSAIDKAGYLWIEEYPLAHDHTLNGYLFALIGLYEYWLATGSAEAKSLIAGGVATLHHYLPQFRNPGGISFYCLKHHVQNAKYHRIHTWQLRLLGRMTGDAYFTRMSQAFARDFS